ncbi:General substrate transporter [Pleurostoma richardsiae]|uniref:General substrate transporter n=1 Tax=Pleurostoma richardsiae TaxID=41990 RepID=A0AA38RJD7_9PEZI|nr:General substrate transporter [Pleurostoma richardsiae]
MRFPKGSVSQVGTTADSMGQKVTLKACFLGLIASVGGFMFGYVSGQISGYFSMSDYAKRFGHDNTFSAARQGAIVGLLSVGCLFGALIIGQVVDRIGRRMTICLSAFWACIGIIIEISSQHAWYQFAIGRFVTGLSIGALSVVVPMYQSESAPVVIRGFLISCYQLFVTLGIWVSNMVNWGTHKSYSDSSQWRITNGLGLLWALILGVGILLLPESPRYIYRKGQEGEARRIIGDLAGVDPNHLSVDDQINQMRAQLEEEKSAADVKWYEIFTGPRMMYRTVLGMVLQAGQQLTGINYYFYYGTTIFKSTGLTDSYVTQIILGSVNVISTFPGLWVAHNVGRRKGLIVGAVWMMVCFFIYAFVGHLKLNLADPTETPGIGKVLIVFACLDIFAFAATWGPLAWTVIAEMYPSRYRGPCMALATATNWFWNFLIGFFTPYITRKIDFYYGLVFAVCCGCLALIVFFFLIETKGHSLEEIDIMHVQRVNPINSAKWEPSRVPHKDVGGVKKSAGETNHPENNA